MSPTGYDVVVIGAGPAGEVAAGRLGENGLSVALVESHLVGGECSYYGCMPSKGLLRPAQAVAEARRIPGAAEAVGGDLDVQAVLDRRDEIVHDLDDSAQLPWLEARNVTLVRGHGRLDGERRVKVGDDVLEASRAVVIAVGTHAAVPPIPGLREAKPWTNHEVTTAKAIPERLVVLGGGVIGAEMAQAYRTLGAEVTIVEGLPRLLANEEEFASEQVLDAMHELGIEVKLGAKATAVRRDAPGGAVTVELETGESVTGDELLCAVGRRPLTGDLGVDLVGGEPGRPLEVTDTMQVAGHDWLYVVGDANGRVLLTHMGKYQARLASDHILGRPVELRSDGAQSPRVTFTEPQVAAVGHTLAKAQEAGLNARAVDVGTSGTAGGSFYGRGAPGTARLVVDEDRSVIVGATITGPTSRTSCTPRLSPWSARFRSTASGTRCLPSRRAARSGCGCWRSTGCDGSPGRQAPFSELRAGCPQWLTQSARSATPTTPERSAHAAQQYIDPPPSTP